MHARGTGNVHTTITVLYPRGKCKHIIFGIPQPRSGLADISRLDPPPSRDSLPMFSSYVDLDRSACIIATKLIGLAFIFLELMRLELGSTSVFASGA